MHYHIRLVFSKNSVNDCFVANIALVELITVAFGNSSERLQVSGIGQFVEVQNFVICFVDQMANDRRTDKACAAGDLKTFYMWCSVVHDA